MNYSKLNKLKEKLYFTSADVKEVLGITLASAQVLCSRYVKQGLFVRLKNNFYILDSAWGNLSKEEIFKISNFLQVPSYVSFMSALSFYEITTQVQRDFYESASLKRSINFDCRGVSFNFYKIKQEYYFGFEKKDNIFIAVKEKALIDAVYLYSFGKYKMDFSSIDFGAFDKGKLSQMSKVFPNKTRNLLEKLCKI
jgi:predicted transcriptional regulator of viral defense system